MNKLNEKLHRVRPTYILLALIIIFLGKKTLPIHENFIGGHDISFYFYWSIHFIKEQILSGNIPLWNPYFFCGQPFLANPVNSIFYPSTLLYLSLPLPLAFCIDTTIHLYLAAMGMYCLVFLITKSKGSGLSAAIIFSLSGYMIARIFGGHLNMFHPAALIPWIFYFIEKAFVCRKPLFLLISGTVLGIQILGGDAQASFYSAFFLTLYFVIRYLSISSPFRQKQLLGFGLFYFLIPVTAFGLSAIQILPAKEFADLSMRALNSFEFATYMSFSPSLFFSFLAPRVMDINWEYWGYIGILAIVLAFIGGLIAIQNPYRWCFRIMLIIAVTIMLGHYTPIYKLYFKFFPLIATFRIPARCVIIVIFCLSVFAGFGAKYISENTFNKAWKKTAAGTIIIILLGLFFGAKTNNVDYSSDAILLAFGLITCTAIILFIAGNYKKKPMIMGIIVLFLFGDLYINHHHLVETLNANDLLKKSSYEKILTSDTGYHRVNIPFNASPMRGLYFKYFCASGYSPLISNHYYKFIHEMAGIQIPEFQRHTPNVKLFSKDKIFIDRILGIKYGVLENAEGYQFLRKPQILPRVFLVENAIYLPNLEDHLKYFKRPDFNPLNQVILLEADKEITHPGSRILSDHQKIGKVKIVFYESNRIKILSESKRHGFLVLCDNYFPGWSAYVDGKKEKILQADYLIRAISLSPGNHEIVFKYNPISFRIGAAISLLSIISIVFVFLFIRKDKLIFNSKHFNRISKDKNASD